MTCITKLTIQPNTHRTVIGISRNRAKTNRTKYQIQYILYLFRQFVGESFGQCALQSELVLQLQMKKLKVSVLTLEKNRNQKYK